MRKKGGVVWREVVVWGREELTCHPAQLPPHKNCGRNTRQAQIKQRVLLCYLSPGAFEPFGKRLRTFFNLAFSPLAADVQGGQPSRFRLSRSSPGRCCR